MCLCAVDVYSYQVYLAVVSLTIAADGSLVFQMPTFIIVQTLFLSELNLHDIVTFSIM